MVTSCCCGKGRNSISPPMRSFDTPLFERRGGIQLRDKTTAVVDQLGWGADAPPSFTAGSPAPAPADGRALERLPGGAAGSGQQSDDNNVDFQLVRPQSAKQRQPPHPAAGTAAGTRGQRARGSAAR
jgi:hypothetical protein